MRDCISSLVNLWIGNVLKDLNVEDELLLTSLLNWVLFLDDELLDILVRKHYKCRSIYLQTFVQAK